MAEASCNSCKAASGRDRVYPRVQSMRVTDWRLERVAGTDVALLKMGFRGFFRRGSPVICFSGALHAVVVDVSQGGCEG